MDAFFENAPALLTAAAKSPLGILALMVMALTAIALVWFRSSSTKIKVGIWLLFLVCASAYAFLVIQTQQADNFTQSQVSASPTIKSLEEPTGSNPIKDSIDAEQCNENNPLLECLWRP